MHPPTQQLQVERIELLRGLASRYDEIIALLDRVNEEPNVIKEEHYNILGVPLEFQKMDDLRVRSQRLSIGVEEGLDLLLEKYLKYIKTSLINYAIDNLVKEYPKD